MTASPVLHPPGERPARLAGAILPGGKIGTSKTLPWRDGEARLKVGIMIEICPGISIGEDEIGERFIRASGPGGQNVNKVSTAVELRFNARGSPNLPDDVSVRLQKLAGSRLTGDGVIVIVAESYRTQEANRRDALQRLVDLIREAAIRPRKRYATRPTLASRTRRLESKGRRAGIKAARGRPSDD